MVTRQRIALLLTGLVVLTGIAAVPASEVPSSPCAGATERCTASIRVPLNWADPDSPRLSIPYVWLPHRDREEASAGTILGLQGGPDQVADPGSVKEFTTALGSTLADHDLLIVERRGFGESTAWKCPELTVHDPATITACANQPQGRYDNTAQRVADIDAVRVVLGLDRLILYGNSYGSVDGPAYAARYPRHTAAAILDSPNDPLDARTGFAQGMDFPHIQAAQLATVPVPCARSVTCRVLPGTARGRVEQLVTRLRAHPDPRVSLQGLNSVLAYRMPWTAQQLNGAAAAYLAGDKAPLRRLVSVAGPPPGQQDPDPMLRMHPPAYLAYFCNDSEFHFDRSAGAAQRRKQLADYRRTHPERPMTTAEAFGRYGAYEDWCANWTTGVVDPPVPTAARYPDIPVLTIAGTLDAGAVSSARQLAARFGKRGQTLVVPFGTHAGSLTPSIYRPCVDAAIRSFITAPRRPVTDHCSGENFRALGRFPRGAMDWPATAYYTAADAVAPFNPNNAFGPSEVPGLRGGTITHRDNRVTLNEDRFLPGTAVSGTVELTGDGTAHARLRTAGHRIELSWRPWVARETVRLRGTADGRPFSSVLPRTS
ncbi:alpha/beta fold hydrolase [Sciscionella sediminilitoris]|uniref:alpha/beta fold hydrolase n=1 Tax=Sciscionella sediminilitoris TaxID=1445613 RepID=UPI0006EB627F|nr:alpha/beta hydrolase [Sciscionella sp. SE31]